MKHKVNYSISLKPDKGICIYIQVKPNSRLSEANILTILRNSVSKIEDME
jgi:hypothetical protein